eukprot:COSAG01_NODE_26726_length_705_cov_0.731023_1_plen_63_part_00
MIYVVRSGKMNQFEEALGLLMLCCLRSVEVGDRRACSHLEILRKPCVRVRVEIMGSFIIRTD